MTPPVSHVLAEVCPGFLAPAAGGQGRRSSVSEACAQCAAADFRCRCNKDRESSEAIANIHCQSGSQSPPQLLSHSQSSPQLLSHSQSPSQLLPHSQSPPQLLSHSQSPPQLLPHTVQNRGRAGEGGQLIATCDKSPLLINCHINTDINTDIVCYALNRTYTATERATRADAAFCT